jgi:hypothetical protein
MTAEGFAQADAFMRQTQSRADRAERELNRYEEYNPLIEEIEQNPRVANGVIDVLKGRNTPAGETGSGADTPPDLKIEVETDEFGTATGKGTVDMGALQEWQRSIISEARQAGAQAASSALQTSERTKVMNEGVKSFKDSHEELNDSQVKEMLQMMKDLPPAEAMELLYNGAKGRLTGIDPAQAARQEGQDEAFEQMRRAESLGPAVGAMPGGAEKPQNFQQRMMAELKAVDQEEDLQGVFDD